MPRPPKCRLIAAGPPLSAFKPAGVPGHELETIELALDELESLRLADLEGLYHEAAARRMQISRPTFGRLLKTARHKVACALFQSKMLLFKGGPVAVRGMRTFECSDCTTRFGEPYGTGHPKGCPKCSSQNFCRVDGARAAGHGRCCEGRHGASKIARQAAAARKTEKAT
jgi:uncharacterized protein